MNELPQDIILKVINLKKYYPINKGFLKRQEGYVKAVDGINFDLTNGETLGLVGESGCGKTTVARVILRAIEATAGQVLFRSSEGIKDVLDLEKQELIKLRKDMQMVFQDPYSSLNPRWTISGIISEPLKAFGFSRDERKKRAADLLELVGLDPSYLQRYPHSFSGGQRQRIGIARAIALNPSLIVADEPVSALDVSIQAQILNLMRDLQEELGLTYIFIAHDLSVVRYISDRVAVMYVGNMVELTDTNQLYNNPRHPYTAGLLSAVPDADPDQPWLQEQLKGEVADPSSEFHGCSFVERCKYSEKICRQANPDLEDVNKEGNEHLVACHKVEELTLEGVI